MQPQVEQPESWQQPRQAVPQAPYQPVAEPTQQVAPNVTAQVTVPVDPVVVQPEQMPTPTPSEPPLTSQEMVDEPTDELAEEVSDQGQDSDAALLSWDAAEYVHQQQTPVWFGVMAVVVLGFMAVAFFLMKSITFTILIPVMAAALVVYVMRPPATNHYTLSRKGLHINDRLYGYEEFKSFWVVSQGAHHSAVLVPRKRFQLGHTVYFPEEIGEQLVDMLAQRLPMKEVSPDLIDRLLSKLHL